MELIFKLSGKHPKLAEAELFAVLEGEGIPYNVVSADGKDRTAVIQAETKDLSFVKRLAYAKEAGIVLGDEEELEGLRDKLRSMSLKGSFAFSGGSHTLREKLGKEVANLGLKVDLKEPDNRFLILGGKIALALPAEEGFSDRKPQMRPYFHPTSLDPRLARALVNLARVRHGDSILDPFCGTGGILIEAGLMDMKVSGIDINPEAVDGCKRNLERYGLRGNIREGDALTMDAGRFDAIVSDLPYGRSSYMTDRNREKLYSGFLSAAKKALEPGKHLVMVTPDASFTSQEAGFLLRESFSVYVHKSLTKNIYVLERT